MIDWQHLHPQLSKNSRSEYPTNFNNYDDESEGIQSKERWEYVKVNMDGVIVGRKICLLEHSSYSSIATQLEDMFGMFQPIKIIIYHYTIIRSFLM